MFQWLIIIFLILFSFQLTYSQDSTRVETLDYVTVKANSGFEIRIIKSNLKPLNLIQSAQVVNTLNRVPGVRMEERSPSSYRINIRGSSQRAPFGIRNVKFYLNGIPFTEPGGNTYFNQLDIRNLDYFQVFKGPNQSEFGAGTGGVVSMATPNVKKSFVQAEGGIGSFGAWNTRISAGQKLKKGYQFISFSKEQFGGYREHSSMEKTNFLWTPHYQFKKHEISATVLYSDLWYQTPGGLNAAQYQSDRKAARPAAGAFPSASTANASIDQKNFLIGATYQYKFKDKWSLFSTLYTSKLELQNPTFRNYEKRSEPHSGGRIGVKGKVDELQINAGLEFQSGNYSIQTYTNHLGNPDLLETNDRVKNNTGFAYANLQYEIKDWNFELGYSANLMKTTISRNNDNDWIKSSTDLPIVHLPKLEITYEIRQNFSISLIGSKGYSPPSSSEVLPSNTVINTALLAEKGNNIEFQGSYVYSKNDLHLSSNINMYYQELKNTIVQRKDITNADYFINAGKTKQLGFEYYGYLYKVFKNKNILDFDFSFNYTDYKFLDYKVVEADYSNNRMPGNMRWTIHSRVGYKFNAFGSINLSWLYADKMYLNDANTFTSEPYRILTIDYQNDITLDKNKKHSINYRLGINNALNQYYSLGFDFNAAANRFYNAAPGINYFLNLGYKYSF